MCAIDWDALRDSGIEPQFASDLGGSEQDRAEFVRGASLLGLVGGSRTLKPQQLLLADVLNAGRRDTSVLLPRRSSKSTTLIGWGLGRAQSEEREDYRVGILTMTSGKAGRSRFLKDVAPVLERHDDGRLHIVRSAGQERVEWRDTGCSVSWLSSLADIRGESFDVLIADEGGEADPEKSADFIAAAGPTMDTRDGAQLVIAGTAGLIRDGNLLYDGLEAGKRGAAGILAFGIDDDVMRAELAAWEPSDEHPEARVRALVELVHPGIGTLTTLDAVRANYERMPIDVFEREYLGRFSLNGAQRSIFDLAAWAKGARGGRPTTPPAGAMLAIVVHPEQSAAAILAAWRDGDGRAHLGVVEHRRGVSWLAHRAAEIALRHNLEIVHDNRGPVLVSVEEMRRMKPRPRLWQQSFGNVVTAAALIVREVANGRVIHYDAEEMNDAVKLARKRSTGPTSWALGRSEPMDDIICIEGAALALRAYDERPPRQALKPSFG